MFRQSRQDIELKGGVGRINPKKEECRGPSTPGSYRNNKNVTDRQDGGKKLNKRRKEVLTKYVGEIET